MIITESNKLKLTKLGLFSIIRKQEFISTANDIITFM